MPYSLPGKWAFRFSNFLHVTFSKTKISPLISFVEISAEYDQCFVFSDTVLTGLVIDSSLIITRLLMFTDSIVSTSDTCTAMITKLAFWFHWPFLPLRCPRPNRGLACSVWWDSCQIRHPILFSLSSLYPPFSACQWAYTIGCSRSAIWPKQLALTDCFRSLMRSRGGHMQQLKTAFNAAHYMSPVYFIAVFSRVITI